jgi:XTP/dITP diphosphohydrolase
VTRLLLATTNAAKLAELRAFFKRLPIQATSLKELGSWPEIVEDGLTFEANALKKARKLAHFSGVLTLADDSGLEVDALNGAPGIRSARYSGDEANDRKNNEKLLEAMKNVPAESRQARFVCVLALCSPDPAGMKEWTVHEECEGRIAFSLTGTNGFGYDPLFFYPPFGKTFGEIEGDKKATVSHRGKALRRLVDILLQHGLIS